MDKPIKKIDYKKLIDILSQKDKLDFYEGAATTPDSGVLHKALEKYIDIEGIENKAVLGIDIYKYGNFENFKQSLIPFLFKMMFKETIDLCLSSNVFLFQNYTEEDFEKTFISTGDGGFQMFDTPMHALVFAICFESVLRTYNSFHLYPRLRKVIGEINLRYALTYDTIYGFEKNYYGRAIIHNARILSRDSLNRCLIDDGTYHWFLINTKGVENLQILTLNEISDIPAFSNYNRKYIKDERNVIFSRNYTREMGIINADILKIGKIQTKESELSIYNIHLQVLLHIGDAQEKKVKIFTISLGNLNTTGIQF